VTEVNEKLGKRDANLQTSSYESTTLSSRPKTITAEQRTDVTDTKQFSLDSVCSS
jgi:hypothetical protein